MGKQDLPLKPDRRDRLIREQIHDTYKMRISPPGPSLCPRCGAVYRSGRWEWPSSPPSDAHELVCQACHRINDDYPAGEVVITGDFAQEHKDEVVGRINNVQKAENDEHPLNRIMAIEEQEGAIRVTTTDIHLPHRIGHALQQAWEGELTQHFDEAGHFARVMWHRD